jgi:small conductance mechanosensitive channel
VETQVIIDFLTAYGIKVVGAILILLIGRFVAGLVRRGVRDVMTKRGADQGLIGFVASLAYAGVMIFTVLAALAKFGIQTASFVAVLGAAGFAVGFALQGSLSNFASGVMLLVFRPFKVGDVVEAGGVKGKVTDIAIFSTTITTPDNVKIIAPNSKIYGDVITNYNGYDTRRVDWTVGIGYDANIDDAKRVLMEVLNGDSRVLKDPDPVILLTEMADSSINLSVRAWAKAADYWNLYFECNQAFKETLDANGIDIPFPQRVVHMATSDSQGIEGAAS